VSEPDFNKFLDDLILAAADRQSSAEIEPIDFFDLCADVYPEFSPTWRDMSLDRLTGLEWATFKPYSHSPGRRALFITHVGIARASDIRKQRLPLSWSDKVASDKFQKIGNLSISLLSFFVSIGALSVAIFALSKSN
jgi:hypothetical protein